MAEKATRWEIFQDVDGLWRFRFVAGNGEIVCQSEAYTDKPACNDGIDVIEGAVRASSLGNILSTLPRHEVTL